MLQSLPFEEKQPKNRRVIRERHLPTFLPFLLYLVSRTLDQGARIYLISSGDHFLGDLCLGGFSFTKGFGSDHHEHSHGAGGHHEHGHGAGGHHHEHGHGAGGHHHEHGHGAGGHHEHGHGAGGHHHEHGHGVGGHQGHSHSGETDFQFLQSLGFSSNLLAVFSSHWKKDLLADGVLHLLISPLFIMRLSYPISSNPNRNPWIHFLVELFSPKGSIFFIFWAPLILILSINSLFGFFSFGEALSFIPTLMLIYLRVSLSIWLSKNFLIKPIYAEALALFINSLFFSFFFFTQTYLTIQLTQLTLLFSQACSSFLTSVLIFNLSSFFGRRDLVVEESPIEIRPWKEFLFEKSKKFITEQEKKLVWPGNFFLTIINFSNCFFHSADAIILRDLPDSISQKIMFSTRIFSTISIVLLDYYAINRGNKEEEGFQNILPWSFFIMFFTGGICSYLVGDYFPLFFMGLYFVKTVFFARKIKQLILKDKKNVTFESLRCFLIISFMVYPLIFPSSGVFFFFLKYILLTFLTNF